MIHPLLAGVDSSTCRVLRQAGEVAADLGLPLYLVGGSVRDALRGYSHLDCDLVTEGAAADLAAALAERWRVPATLHDRFMTASLRLADGTAVDITTARSECYPRPGALPEVTPADISRDLWRRDFGINAIALRLDPAQGETLLDPTGGRADLEAGLVRALHARSFWDDPTRMVRAIAFEQRLGLSLAPATTRWLLAAARDGALATVSAQRVRDALLPALGLPAGPLILRRMADLGLLGPIVGADSTGDQATRFLERVETGLAELDPRLTPRARVIACLVALVVGRVIGAQSMTAHLHLDHHLARELANAAQALDRWPAGLTLPSCDSHLVAALQGVSWGALVALWLSASSESVRTALQRYWTRLRLVRADITGAHLLAHGVRPGPALGEALRAALAAKLECGANANRQLEVALEAAAPQP